MFSTDYYDWDYERRRRHGFQLDGGGADVFVFEGRTVDGYLVSGKSPEMLLDRPAMETMHHWTRYEKSVHMNAVKEQTDSLTG